jgi:antitoxin component YwqK of YwqJK toxin-antitoxin module
MFNRISQFTFLLSFILFSVNVIAQKKDSVNYYPNKKVHEIFTSIDSMKMNYQEFDSIGNLKRTGNILAYYVIRDNQVEDTATHMFVLVLDTHRNVKMGIWTEYYPTGKRKLECNYDSLGISYGMYTTWYENGQVDSTGPSLYFSKSGTWNYYYENGIKKRVEIFEDEIAGTEKYWFERTDFYLNGNIKQIEQFEHPEDRIGEFFVFYDGNKLKEYGNYSEKRIAHIENDTFYFYYIITVKTGLWITFDENENIQSIENYDNDGNKMEITPDDKKSAEEKRLKLLQNKAQIISQNSSK